jgi:hypothetical protein
MFYAHINETNMVVGKLQTTDAVNIPEYIEITEEQYRTLLIRSIWNGNRFLAPEPIVPTNNFLSKLEYMNRFTDTELENIYTAAKTVTSVEIWLEKFKLAANIDLLDQRTIAGVNALEAAGLLATGRAAEILA